jgi:type I restriction enzyme S subunit
MIPNDKISVFKLYFWAKANMKLIESKANGSTFKEISKSEFRALLITIGSRHNEYLLKSSELFARIESNLIENQILKPQREHLLPKLISGEVKIKMEHKS